MELTKTEKRVLISLHLQGSVSYTHLDVYKRQVIDFCENLKTELKQEAIALEINGEMYFI